MDLHVLAQNLRKAGTPFVLATVVRVEKPASASVGSKAIVTRDASGAGVLTGWVGGSCAEPVVLRESLLALVDLQPRLMHLAPQAALSGIARNGLVEIPMACVSDGTLEIYLEPNVPQPRLVLIGHLPVVEALCALGRDIGYDVLVMGQGASAGRFPRADVVLDYNLSALELDRMSYVVVASHGNYDEPALEAALRSAAPYVALVSSQKRLAKVREYLLGSGLSAKQLARLKCPAGLDVGAVTPEEIALSILAEIVQLRRRGTLGDVSAVVAALGAAHMETGANFDVAVDPVCEMHVTISTALWKAEHAGQMFYFCAPGCKRSFMKTPELYLAGHREPM